MKKLIAVLCAAVLMTSLLAACTGSSSSDYSADTTTDTSSSSSDMATDSTATDGEAATEEADTAKLDSIVSTIEAVNPVPNPRALEEFNIENDFGLTMDNIVAFKGDVTNTQAECALVLAVQAKIGCADAVKDELEAYKESASTTLYAEYADKVAKTQDARIVVKDNFVVMVISAVDGPDYADIDAAIDSALA